MKVGSGKRASIIKLIWALFLHPDYVRNLNLGAIWNFCERRGLPELGIRIWGMKGLF